MRQCIVREGSLVYQPNVRPRAFGIVLCVLKSPYPGDRERPRFFDIAWVDSIGIQRGYDSDEFPEFSFKVLVY